MCKTVTRGGKIRCEIAISGVSDCLRIDIIECRFDVKILFSFPAILLFQIFTKYPYYEIHFRY